MEILNDGSIKGKSFSGKEYKGDYPSPKIGETYSDYHNRVRNHVELGLHLGDQKITGKLEYRHDW